VLLLLPLKQVLMVVVVVEVEAPEQLYLATAVEFSSDEERLADLRCARPFSRRRSEEASHN